MLPFDCRVSKGQRSVSEKAHARVTSATPRGTTKRFGRMGTVEKWPFGSRSIRAGGVGWLGFVATSSWQRAKAFSFNKVVTVDSDLFRDFLSRFASGVTVVTTRDSDGEPWGFTASSFASLSADPQYVLVCLNRTAECYAAFDACEEFVVNILHAEQQDTAMVFATRGSDKFGTTETVDTPGGTPVVSGSLATLTCRLAHTLEGGDHVILIGEAVDGAIGEGEPMLYYNRGFRTIAE